MTFLYEKIVPWVKREVLEESMARDVYCDSFLSIMWNMWRNYWVSVTNLLKIIFPNQRSITNGNFLMDKNLAFRGSFRKEYCLYAYLRKAQTTGGRVRAKTAFKQWKVRFQWTSYPPEGPTRWPAIAEVI